MASYRIYRDSNVEDAFNAVINCDIQKLEENYSDFDYATTIDPSITDDTFEMTAIHWAAFSGHVKMVQWLLNKGVRAAMKENDCLQTALHCGVIGRNSKIIRLLLDAGADRNFTDALGYTAMQLASCLGDKNIKAALHNYITEEELAEFSMPNDFGDQTTLPTKLVKPLWHLIMLVNAHPFRVAIDIPPMFYDSRNFETINRALKIMRDRKMANDPRNYDMAMSYKLHYISCVLREIKDQYPMPCGTTPIEWFVSRLNFHEITMNEFMMKTFETFPYITNPTFQELLSFLKYFSHDVNAFNVAMLILGYSCGFNQMENSDRNPICSLCTEIGASEKCTYCNKAIYCDETCKLLHWPNHEGYCEGVAALVLAGGGQISAYVPLIEGAAILEETEIEEEMTTNQAMATEEKTTSMVTTFTNDNSWLLREFLICIVIVGVLQCFQNCFQ